MFHMRTLKKLAGLLALIIISGSAIAQLTPTGAYLLGNIAEIAINNNGHEGTSDPGGTHARSDQWDPAVYFGFVANPQNDGWMNYDGDFFTPGSPENGFGIEVNGVNYSNNSSYYNEIPGGLSNYVVDGNCLSVDWNGTIAGVGVKITYHFITTELYYTTEVTLTNNTGGALNDLYFYRNFDPDNNVFLTWDYTTQNTIVSQPTPSCPKALVSATQANPWLSYVGIAAIGQQFRVSYGGFANRDASDIWNGVAGLTGTVGATSFNDEAISLAYKINSLPAGASETFEFVIILDDTQVDEAFAQLYDFSFSGSGGSGSVCNPVTDTAYLACPGQSIQLDITGPGVTDYNWVWTPGTGLTPATGPTVMASPATSTLYTVTGTPINPCLSMSIVKEIYVQVGTGPLVSITPPAATCGAFDLTTLVVTDLNGVPGTTTTFHTAIPASATDMSNQLVGTTMNPGDVIYVMIADPVGGCFDYEQVIVNFSGGTTAGPDNTSTLCNTAGSTIDVNTLLGAGIDPGTWTETTSSGQFNATTGVFDASGLAAGNYTFEYQTTVVAPCTPDVAVMTITVNQNAQAGADNTSDICNTTGSTIDLNSLLSGNNGIGTWAETSASGQFNSTTGVLDAAGLTAGAYTFTYTVNGIAPCTPDVADFTINVQQEALAGADNASTICNTAGSTIDLNTLLAGNNGIGTWTETTSSGQFNATTGVFDASSLTVGVYNFTYTVTGVAPCPSDIANFAITVTNLPNAGADNNATLCNLPGSTLTLSTLLSGSDPGGTWAETSAIPSGQFNSGTTVLDVANTSAGTYTFTYTLAAVGPCAGDQAVFTVTIEQYADAGSDNSTAVCNAPGSTLNMNTLLVGNNGAGVWAETTSSGQFNTVTGVFTSAGLTAGTYTFTYTVNAVAPCVPDVSNFTVIVIDLPQAGLDNNATLCNSSGTTINLNTLLNGNNMGGIWAETTSSGQFNTGSGILDASGLATGTYTFTYTVPSVGACPGDQALFTIQVISEPSITDLADQSHCDSYTLPVIGGTSLTGNQGYFTGPNGTGTQVNAGTLITASTTLYLYDETGTMPNCYDEEMVIITINPTPVVSFTADTLSGCAPLVVNFTNTTPGTNTNCVWNFGDGFGQLCGGIQHTYLNPGTYTVSLTLQGTGACPGSTTYTNYITVVAPPEAEFTFSPQIPDIYNSEVTFTNSSDDADYYEWHFGDGTTSFDTNTVHLYPAIGNMDYLVTLYAYNSYGCMDSVSQIVTVQDVITFYIPNSFTPDGDEFNQYFQPVFSSGVDPYDFHMVIFDRWGEVMFETYNFDYGWNGTYGDQGLVENGVYVWQIEFKETMSDKRHTHRGHVTVLK
ncbi:MAG: gliding motility-associated C-terminal domain-containing protein [Crocinitomicaceae bacterium]|nr:gliding motility-associated C-terminal domain-containing protein [Crocinitomicaceae bacterium]